MSDIAAERYIRLGLQIGRHEDGMVDAYFGPPELKAASDTEPLPEPRELVTAAEALLDDLDDTWLRDQVVGLRTYAGVLAGEALSYVDEVKGCYGVSPAYTDEETFLVAHEQLAELLPGGGSLRERYEQWQHSTIVPPDLIESTTASVIGQARAWTSDLIELPPDEGIDLRIVRGKPWLGFNEYVGGMRGNVYVNVSMPKSAMELLHLALHETYPGHQAERVAKEDVLVNRGGRLEESIVMVATPQSLITEGIAEVAPHLVLDSEAGPAFERIINDAGIPFDLERAIAIEAALQPCRWAEVNGALMLHEKGASAAEVHAYLQRWGLMTSELADHLIRFYEEPTSRTYIVAYPAGQALCGAYVAGNRDRFRQLLTSQVRVKDLITLSAHDH